MFKSISLGVGIFLLLVGVCLHGIDSYKTRRRPVATALATNPIEGKQVTPEPWKPWAYTAAGVVAILWTCTLPKRMGGK